MRRTLAQWAARTTGALRAGLVATFDLRDIFWVGGLSAVTYGVWQVHEPAAWIVCGAVLFWMGVRA